MSLHGKRVIRIYINIKYTITYQLERSICYNSRLYIISLKKKLRLYIKKHVIVKILFAGVTTIAGGKSNVAGYRDGPGEDAMFSNDFDVMYVRSTCSLLVIDRGNAAIRQISLNQEDCEYQDSSISNSGMKHFLVLRFIYF